MEVSTVLSEIGFSDREARLYTALLESGEATPLQLANKTGLKRPTVYLDLENLKRRRLVAIAFRGKKQVYVAASPNRIRENFDRQRQAMEQVLPFLNSLHRRDTSKPDIRYYEGLQAVERIWLDETWKSPASWYISRIAKLIDLFPHLLAQFEARRRDGTIRVSRELVTSDPKDIEYAKKYHRRKREIYIMPDMMHHNFLFDVQIWGDNVGLFSFPDRFILVMSGKEMAESFRALFQLAWLASRPPR